MSKILFDSKPFALQNSTVFFHLLFKGKQCPWASVFLIHVVGNLTDIIFFHWWFSFTNSPIEINVQFHCLLLKEKKKKKPNLLSCFRRNSRIKDWPHVHSLHSIYLLQCCHNYTSGMFRHCLDRLRLLHRLQRAHCRRLRWVAHNYSLLWKKKTKTNKNILLLVAHDVAFDTEENGVGRTKEGRLVGSKERKKKDENGWVKKGRGKM